MKRLALYLATPLLVAACQPAPIYEIGVSTKDFYGAWFLIVANRAETVLANFEFYADGTLSRQYYSCYGKIQISVKSERGTWEYDDGELTIDYKRSQLAAEIAANETHENRVMTTPAVWNIVGFVEDRMSLKNFEVDSLVTLSRRRNKSNYDCATTKQQISKDEKRAIEATLHEHRDHTE